MAVLGENSIKIKICGLMSAEDAKAVLEAGADYAGVILAKGFRRSITAETAKQIHDALEGRIPLVGVFVNDDAEEIVGLLNEDIINVCQLHGDESDEEIRLIETKTNKPAWKVFKLDSTRLEEQLRDIEECSADMVLLDAGTGTGECFDWSLTEKIQRPFILAGGLNPQNVREAILQTSPFAVDTSSGVETDGLKDKNKIFAFCEAARRQ